MWAVIIAVGLGSYVFRAVPLLLDSRWSGSSRFDRTIAHAGTAALGALVAAGLRRDATSPAEALALAAGAGVGIAVAVRRGSMLRVLLLGGAAYAAALLLGSSIG